MYGLNEFPSFLRGSFQLPSDPYDVGKDALDYLRNLGVVFYRSEDHPIGIIIEPDDFSESIREKRGFNGFRFQCIIGEDCDDIPYKIQQWESEDDPDQHAKIVAKHGDDFSWLIWNEPKLIHEINSYEVKAS